MTSCAQHAQVDMCNADSFFRGTCFLPNTFFANARRYPQLDVWHKLSRDTNWKTIDTRPFLHCSTRKLIFFYLFPKKTGQMGDFFYFTKTADEKKTGMVAALTHTHIHVHTHTQNHPLKFIWSWPWPLLYSATLFPLQMTASTREMSGLLRHCCLASSNICQVLCSSLLLRRPVS